jgi:hypothetical protein
MNDPILVNRFTLDDLDFDLLDVELLEEVPELAHQLHRSKACQDETVVANTLM